MTNYEDYFNERLERLSYKQSMTAYESFLGRLQEIAQRHGHKGYEYSAHNVKKRLEYALSIGKTHAEFYTDLWREVHNYAKGFQD